MTIAVQQARGGPGLFVATNLGAQVDGPVIGVKAISCQDRGKRELWEPHTGNEMLTHPPSDTSHSVCLSLARTCHPPLYPPTREVEPYQRKYLACRWSKLFMEKCRRLPKAHHAAQGYSRTTEDKELQILENKSMKGVPDDLGYISSVEERLLVISLHQPLKACPQRKGLLSSPEFRIGPWSHLPHGMTSPGLFWRVRPRSSVLWWPFQSCRETSSLMIFLK